MATPRPKHLDWIITIERIVLLISVTLVAIFSSPWVAVVLLVVGVGGPTTARDLAKKLWLGEKPSDSSSNS